MIHSFGLIYSFLFCVFFLPILVFLPSYWYPSHYMCVDLNKQPLSLSGLVTFHHLSNWSLCSFTTRFASDLNALQPCGGFAAIRQILLFIKVALVFPAGNCPTPQRTLPPCWAHLRKEPSTWRGPSLLMATVRSYVTSWRFRRIVSHVSCVSRASFVISFRKGCWSGINVIAKKT